MNRTNKTPQLLLLDAQSAFTDRLASSVRSAWLDRLNLVWSDSLDAVSAETLDETDVCLFSHAHAKQLHSRLWPPHTRFFLLCDATDDSRVSRYLPLTSFLEHVTDKLDLAPAATERRGSVDLLLAFDRTERDRFAAGLLRRETARRETVYYLPLMPTYLIRDALRQEQGDSLTELLLQLEAGLSVDDKHLGHVFAAHADGYYMPRLPERGDDLILAGADTLARLLDLLRARIDKSGRNHYGLVVCDSLPLDTVGRLASYCDRLLLESERDGSDTYPRRRGELDRLLASLPSSCRVEPMGEV